MKPAPTTSCGRSPCTGARSTNTTPVEITRALLNALASGDAAQTAVGSQVSGKNITKAIQPLADAGWGSAGTHQGEHAAGVQFDT